MKNLKTNWLKHILWICVILVSFSSCEKDDDFDGGRDAESEDPSAGLLGDIYLAGKNEIDGMNCKSIYFKNSEAIELEGVGAYTQAEYIQVIGDDVHVLGWSRSVRQPIYWKNGVSQILEHPNPSSIAVLGDIASPIGLAVSGEDVHMAMQRYSNIGLSFAIYYWKNGVRTVIPAEDDRENFGYGMMVNGDDVYIYGRENHLNRETFDSAGEWPIAKYWKNGVGVNITNGDKTAFITKMVVKDDDLYLSYTKQIDGGTLSYILKNGVEILVFPNLEKVADFIVDSSDDVHAVISVPNTAGSFGLALKYYKNDIGIQMVSNLDNGLRIRKFEDDIYVSGFYYDDDIVRSQILKNNTIFSNLEFNGSGDNIEVYDMTIN